MTPAEDARPPTSPNASKRTARQDSWTMLTPVSVVSDVHRSSLDNNSIRLVNPLPPPPPLLQQSEEIRTPPPPDFVSRMSSTGSIPHGASPPALTPSNPNYKILPSPPSTVINGSTRDHRYPEPPHTAPVSREAIGHIDASQTHEKEKEVLRKKNRGSGMLAGMFSHPVAQDQRTSPDDHDSIASTLAPEKPHEKERHSLRNFFGTPREKARKEEQRVRPPDNNDRAAWDMTRLIGWTTSTNVDDWAVVMEVCDKANQSDSDAKEASKAIRKDIQFGRPPAQLAAARLWAIMMRNCPVYFIARTADKKFIGEIEKIALSPATLPVIRDRLVEVIGTSVFQLKDSKHLKPYQATWKRLRAQFRLAYPPEGIELKPDDPMVNPTPHRPPSSMRHHPMNEQSQPDLNSSVTPGVADLDLNDPLAKEDREQRREERSQRQKEARLGVISQEEDIRRLFEECEIARDNLKILAEALVFATTESINADPLIKEFRQKCFKSQEIIAAQIDWATAQADRARAKQLALIGPGEFVPTTTEEQLLGALCTANTELNDVFKQYDDLERMAISEREEAEALERSQVDYRLDRTKEQVYEGGVFITAPETEGASRSRSNTPLPQRRPLPQPTPSSPHNNHNSLAPPPAAPHGPRPLSRNRTPSPLHGDQATDLSSLEDEAPHFPSEKAMGKRRAEPDPEEEDDWPEDTSLLPLDANDNDDENANPKQPEVFMYDEAAEKKKQKQALNIAS